MPAGVWTHPLQHVLNVHWAGAVFVGATCNPAVSYTNKKTREGLPKWTSSLDAAAFFQGGNIYGSSFAEFGDDDENRSSAFILVGDTRQEGLPSNGIIAASKDGVNWEEVHRVTPVGDLTNTSTVDYVVWHEPSQAFYAHAFRQDAEAGIFAIDSLLRSSDGFTWSEDERVNIPPDATPESYPRGLIAPFCHLDFVNEDGHPCPDGIFGRREEDADRPEKVIIPTKFPTPGYLNAGLSFPASVSPVSDISFPVRCVAFAEGVWMALGANNMDETEIFIPQGACSFDDGETWKDMDPNLAPGELCVPLTLSGGVPGKNAGL